jgi:hypothetical protein
MAEIALNHHEGLEVDIVQDIIQVDVAEYLGHNGVSVFVSEPFLVPYLLCI